MAQSYPHRPIALVVEDDEDQRHLVTVLLEESEMTVIQCESAEAAELVMNKVGGALSLIFTDVKLAGHMSGIELANIVQKRFPDLAVIITSGHGHANLPENTVFMPKPWNALDILIEAQRAIEHGYH
jgi:DNA-binding NtrC family response regulator